MKLLLLIAFLALGCETTPKKKSNSPVSDDGNMVPGEAAPMVKDLSLNISNRKMKRKRKK